MELTVQVITADIENGVERDCEECPLAIAVYRSLLQEHPELAELIPFVDEERILLFRESDIEFSALLTEEIRKFITDFDENRQVTPFTVTLTFTPDSWREMAWRSSAILLKLPEVCSDHAGKPV